MLPRRRIHEALKHLGTDYIDVLVLRLVPSTDVDIPIEAAAKEMKVRLNPASFAGMTCVCLLSDGNIAETPFGKTTLPCQKPS